MQLIVTAIILLRQNPTNSIPENSRNKTNSPNPSLRFYAFCFSFVLLQRFAACNQHSPYATAKITIRFEGVLVYCLRIKQQLQPAFGFTTFFECNFKFREHIRLALSVIGFTNIGINATGTFANLEKSVGRCFYVLTNQFDISCKLFRIDQQVIFCHINHSFQTHYTTFSEINQRLAVAYHQCEALYITNTQCCISSSRRSMHLRDDIRLSAMIYTLKRDDIPSLRLG